MKFLLSLVGLLIGAAALFFLVESGPSKDIQGGLLAVEDGGTGETGAAVSAGGTDATGSSTVTPKTGSTGTTASSGAATTDTSNATAAKNGGLAKADKNAISYKIGGTSAITFTGYKGPVAQVAEFDPPSGTFEMPTGKPEGGQIKATVETEFVWHAGEVEKYQEVVAYNILDTENHPEASFESKGIAKKGDKYYVTGDLTVKGVTKAIGFDADITHDDDSFALTAEMRLPRKAWNLVYKGTYVPDRLINDEFLLELDLKGSVSK